MVKKPLYLLKNFSTLLLMVALLVTGGCAKKKATELTEDGLDPNATFFDVVYQVRASREIGTASWIAVSGIQRVKFLRTVVAEDGTESGNFTFQFTSYKEPQLFNSTACSGGFEGTFATQPTTSTPTDNGGGVYNPQDPYDPGNTGGSGDTETTQSSYYFGFNLNVTRRSLSSGCTSVNPLSSFSLIVIRFANGDLQITNSSRSLEFYLVPEII